VIWLGGAEAGGTNAAGGFGTGVSVKG
jgi:hypothetical protein